MCASCHTGPKRSRVVTGPSPNAVFRDNRVTLIYVIGGAARCGKTELALRLLRAHALPIFSTDVFTAFMQDLDAGGPPPTPWSDEEWMARSANARHQKDRLRRHLPNLVWMIRGVYGNAILEGVEVLPDNIAPLAERGEIRAVFLIRQRVALEALIAHSDRHDWLRTFGPAVQQAMVAEILSLSAEIADGAERLRIPVVDVSGDFEAAMASAGAALGLPLEISRQDPEA